MTSYQHSGNDLLEAVAFGWATPEERSLVREHISECSECRETLEMLMASSDALLLSAPEPDVQFREVDVWARIDTTISRQASGSDQADNPPVLSGKQQNVSRPRSWSTGQLLAMAALALVSLVAGLLIGRAYLADTEAPSPQNITIQFADPNIQATGSLRYLPEEEVYVLEMENMPELPEGQVYQVWLISDDTPLSAGVMTSASGEFATAGNPDEFQTLAITVEEGPIGVNAPTSDPIVTANLDS